MGAYSTDAKTLEDLAAQGHDIVDDIIQWRQLAKLRSTYTESLQQQINPKTDRVHTSFNLTVTNTGRLSSTDPNLQNIPIRTEEGRLIRTAFVPEKGCKLISIDYSQIELRLVAEMAGLKRLQEAFKNNQDIHALTASEVFGIPLAEVNSERRRAAKAINFGIIYGISGFGLARQLGTDNSTASAYIKTYMQRFPELAAYMADTKAFAKKHGYVETLLGRVIHVPGITSKNGAERSFAERQAINAPIQGTAADIMKLAMIAVDRVIQQQKMPAKILLQVHDELVIEVEENAVETVGNAAKNAMENVYHMDTPLIAEWGSGNNWDEAH
jgi:DNA polymerase-1